MPSNESSSLSEPGEIVDQAPSNQVVGDQLSGENVVTENVTDGDAVIENVTVESATLSTNPVPTEVSSLFIPHFLRHLPTHNGNVSPFIASVDGNKVRRDMHKIIHCVHHNSCGLCGRPLEYWVWFLGNDFEIQRRAFLDPPMHRICAEYVMRLSDRLPNTTGESVDLYLGRTRLYQLRRRGTIIEVHCAPFKDILKAGVLPVPGPK